jgi:membrane protein
LTRGGGAGSRDANVEAVSSRRIEVLDAYQRRHRWLGFAIAVLYKYSDDQGGYMAALVTYYGFLSLFPLLLLTVTVLGFLLHGDPHLQAQLLESTLAKFPIVSAQLRANVHAHGGSGVGLAVGVLVALYGSLGAAQATQNVFNRAWAVPRNRRPNPLKSRARSLLLLVVLGAGVLLTTALSTLGTSAGALGATLSGGLRVVLFVLAFGVNIAVMMFLFRLLTADEVPTRALRLGWLTAGVALQILQVLGAYFLAHYLKGASESYGAFGLVLGMIAWIYLLALVLVLAVEIDVVSVRRLWPRALLAPFSDDVELTRADRRAYTGYAQSERHKGFETVDVGFAEEDGEAPATGTRPAAGAGSDPDADRSSAVPESRAAPESRTVPESETTSGN